jgi:hypothetical protein
MTQKSGDTTGIYIETECCTSCGVPWTLAPEVFEDGEASCLVKRQPVGATELRKTLRVLRTQDLNCIRYGGRDPRALALLEAADCGEACDRAGADSDRPSRARRPTEPLPPDAKALLVLVALSSAGGALALLVLPQAMSNSGRADALLSVLCLIACWGAQRRTSWGFWGLLAALVARLLSGLFGGAGALAVTYFAAVSVALWVIRRKYLPTRNM